MTDAQGRWTRRQVLTGGLAATVAAGIAGVELVIHDVIPGHQLLNRINGNCTVPQPHVEIGRVGAFSTEQFMSAARNRTVRYTIAYPPGRGPGDPLPLVLVLHAHGRDQSSALSGISLAQAAAIVVDGEPLAPMAFVAVDGGNGYWHARPGDDPLGMLVDELIPLCQDRGLGAPPQRIGVLGTSMGGYGALLLGENHPELIDAVAAISPAVWMSYHEARDGNPGAFTSAADFEANDIIGMAKNLTNTPVRVAWGVSDPFAPGIRALDRVLPASAVVERSKGCHTGPFFASQQPPSLTFLARHIASTGS